VLVSSETHVPKSEIILGADTEYRTLFLLLLELRIGTRLFVPHTKSKAECQDVYENVQKLKERTLG
jgi:hypothetical protein